MKRNKIMRKIGADFLTIALAVSVAVPALLGNMARVHAANLENPRITADTSMTAGQNVMWDCVWFGNYPQAEVVPSATDYTCIKENVLSDGDIIANRRLYNKLKNASGWDANNEITIDGERFRRITVEDVTSPYHGGVGATNYCWPIVSEYHYFRYEPIKWRVLNVNGDQAFLLADKALDDQQFYPEEAGKMIWAESTLRSWLNGYGPSSNRWNGDYTNKNFIDSAFTAGEKAAILETHVVNNLGSLVDFESSVNTEDKIFLLSEEEARTEKAASFGFTEPYQIKDEARWCKSSTYAKAMGTHYINTDSTNKIYNGNCTWWLRTQGYMSYTTEIVRYDGYSDMGGVGVEGNIWGVRPALNLDISSGEWSHAGTVCSDGMMDEVGGAIDLSEVSVSKITLSGLSKKIAAGKKVKLTAKVLPSNASDKAVKWKSGNTKVATVSSTGVVSMKKGSGGKKVTITAIAKDGSGVKASYRITSMKNMVKKVAISGNKSVKAGKSLKLKAKVTAAKNANTKLKWSSSNTKYATVSTSGKVKTYKAGKGKKVKITAAATDGSKKKKTVTVKIK